MNTKYLDLYTDYLAVTFGAATSTGLSNMLEGRISHDTFTRFLADANGVRVSYGNKSNRPENEDGVLIFDDTVQEKPWMDENDLTCWHYDHCKGRSITSINMLNCLYHVDDISIPVAFDLIHKPIRFSDLKIRREKRRSELTKNQLIRGSVPLTT